MSKKYEEKEIINIMNEASKDMNSFYRIKLINYKGKVKGSNNKKYYSEVVSEYLFQHFDLFDKIQVIQRENYKVSSHNGLTKRQISNRLEERIALSLFEKNVSPIGKIIDYQIPLKKIMKDIAGKIDLLAFNEETATLYLIELKAPKSKETLIRSVLEIYTYYKLLNIQKLIENYELKNKCKKIKLCSLFFINSKQDKEYNTLNERINLRNLIHKITKESVEIELLRFSYDILQNEEYNRGNRKLTINEEKDLFSAINKDNIKIDVLKY